MFVLRPNGNHTTAAIQHAGEFFFLFVLRGELGLSSKQHGTHTLAENESCVIPAGKKFELAPKTGLEMLQVVLPAKGL